MLRIYDEFLEDETVLGLSDRAYRLHVSALIYCSKNLTDGDVSARTVKVLQVLLGFSAKRHIAELIDAGLWIEADGGFAVRNYLEFNPSADTVKAERRGTRDRMRKMREKRAQAKTETGDGARDASRDGAVPDQAVPEVEVQDQPGRQFADDECLPIANELMVARLMQRIGSHADMGTKHVIVAYARRASEAALAKVVESLDTQHPRDRAAYVVGALKSELGERAA